MILQGLSDFFSTSKFLHPRLLQCRRSKWGAKNFLILNVLPLFFILHDIIGGANQELVTQIVRILKNSGFNPPIE